MTIPNWLSPNSIIKKCIHDFLYSRDDLLLFLIILFYWKMFNFLPKITPLYFLKNKASCVQGVKKKITNWKSVNKKMNFFSFIYLKIFWSKYISLEFSPIMPRHLHPGLNSKTGIFRYGKTLTRLPYHTLSLSLSPVGGGILLPFPQVTVSSFLPVCFSFYTALHVLCVICTCTNGWYCSSERITMFSFIASTENFHLAAFSNDRILFFSLFL